MSEVQPCPEQGAKYSMPKRIEKYAELEIKGRFISADPLVTDDNSEVRKISELTLDEMVIALSILVPDRLLANPASLEWENNCIFMMTAPNVPPDVKAVIYMAARLSQAGLDLYGKPLRACREVVRQNWTAC